MSGVLTLPLNGIYFDQIAAGEKLEEYRLRTDFWHRRIVGRAYDRVVLTRGYPKGGGVEGVTRLTRQWLGYRMCSLTHPHFGTEPVSVFAIDVSTPTPGERAGKGERDATLGEFPCSVEGETL